MYGALCIEPRLPPWYLVVAQRVKVIYLINLALAGGDRVRIIS
jgi:hypothetical protein